MNECAHESESEYVAPIDDTVAWFLCSICGELYAGDVE